MSSEDEQNLAIAQRYLKLIGSPGTKPEDLRGILAESLVWREMPNLFAPAGRGRRSLTAASLAWWQSIL